MPSLSLINLKSIDADGNASKFVYDQHNRLIKEIDALGGIILRTHDKLGNLKTVTDPVNNVTTFSYDAANNLKTAQDPHGTYTFTYDELNRAETIQDLYGQTLTFTFDAVGNRWVVQDSQGGVTCARPNSDRIRCQIKAIWFLPAGECFAELLRVLEKRSATMSGTPKARVAALVWNATSLSIITPGRTGLDSA